MKLLPLLTSPVPQMTMLEWLKAKLYRLFSAKGPDREMREMGAQREDGSFKGPTANRARNFEADYSTATGLLKMRMNNSFPDSYYARLSSNTNPAYDYGEERASAVDTVSTAIAMALRNGATVQEAAAAGAASVGI